MSAICSRPGFRVQGFRVDELGIGKVAGQSAQ